MKYLFLMTLLLSGCAPAISTSDPDASLSAVRMRQLGDDRYMISCVDSNQYCTSLARNVCGEYSVKSEWGNATAWGDRRTMIVKCK